jgi:hypothetical protein
MPTPDNFYKASWFQRFAFLSTWGVSQEAVGTMFLDEAEFSEANSCLRESVVTARDAKLPGG